MFRQKCAGAKVKCLGGLLIIIIRERRGSSKLGQMCTRNGGCGHQNSWF